MSSMTTKLVIYGIFDLRIFSINKARVGVNAWAFPLELEVWIQGF
jgi:hypothetical protein